MLSNNVELMLTGWLFSRVCVLTIVITKVALHQDKPAAGAKSDGAKAATTGAPAGK